MMDLRISKETYLAILMVACEHRWISGFCFVPPTFFPAAGNNQKSICRHVFASDPEASLRGLIILSYNPSSNIFAHDMHDWSKHVTC